MAVYRNIKIIHIHIPKTAGLSVQRHFQKQNGGPGEYGDHLFLDEYVKSGAVWPDEAEAFHKIAVVRDPWDRALSAYNYCRQFRPWVSWDDFLEWFVEAGRVAEKGIAWGMARMGTRQSAYFGPDDGVEVVRFERLSERFPDLPHVNRVDGLDEMSDPDRRTIAAAYAGDIERFGYGPGH